MCDKILDKVNSPADIKSMNIPELEALAEEIREFIVEKVSINGGHLASNLGAVEVTIAMHYVFDFEKDYLVWDVGHQCYTHKILTGRKAGFERLRKAGGVSGFPEPKESPTDRFSVGHAGTSIGTALGIGQGCVLKGTKEKVVAFVGDGSIVNGASFEALNNLTQLNRQMLVVLNDNSMSIDESRGGLAAIFSRIRLNSKYESFNRTAKRIVNRIPLVGSKVDSALHRFKRAIRMQQSACQIFESMELDYFGPVNGHDISGLIKLFTALKQHNRPAVLHIHTNKGYGYHPADKNPSKYHSTGPFYINGEAKSKGKRSFTQVLGESLCDVEDVCGNIAAITAAMPEGTGLNIFRDKHPHKFFDVGICESVAVDMAAGMAKTGIRPFVCIYSTFLQRAFDQIAHDVALQGLPVVFCIDRAGVVGDDGYTHNGMLDIAFLRAIPKMIVCAPACERELHAAVMYAAQTQSPMAIRYPRDIIPQNLGEFDALSELFETGKSVTLTDHGAQIVIVSYGAVLCEAVEAARMLAEKAIICDIVNARFAKPIDENIVRLAGSGIKIFTVEDHGLMCGFGSALLEKAEEMGMGAENIHRLGAPDNFIDKNTRAAQLNLCNCSAEAIAAAILKTQV